MAPSVGTFVEICGRCGRHTERKARRMSNSSRCSLLLQCCVQAVDLLRERCVQIVCSVVFSLCCCCPSTHTQLVHDSRPRCSRRILAQRIGSKALLGKLKVRSSTKPLQSETHLHHRPRHCKTIIYNAAATDVFFIEGTMMTVGTLQRPFGQRIVWNHTRGI